MLDAHKQINPHYSILAAAHISHLRIKKKKHMDPKTNTPKTLTLQPKSQLHTVF